MITDWFKLMLTAFESVGIPPVVTATVLAMLCGVLTIITWLKIVTFFEPDIKVPKSVPAPKDWFGSRDA